MEKRLPVSILVNLAPVVRLPADQAELTYTENVSDHGACVVSNHPWQCGEIAEVTSLLDQISLRGQVVHCRQCGDERYAIGLKFRNAVVWPASGRHAVPPALHRRNATEAPWQARVGVQVGAGHMRASQKGFSLIELLLVVVILLIISALAVPNFMRSRMAACEASAVGSMRSINTAATTYASTYPDQGFPASLTTLGGAMPCTPTAASACLIDQVLSSGTKSGYTFVWTSDGQLPSVAYTITATPISLGATGQRMFCSDQSDVIHFDPSGAGCTNGSAPLQ